MQRPEPILIGYNVKRRTPRPSQLAAPGVEWICSASNCICRGLDRFESDHERNSWGLFLTDVDARNAAKGSEIEADHVVFSYRLFPVIFDAGKPGPLEVAHDLAEPPAPNFVRLGYDAVGLLSRNPFSCSPLSCNSGAAEIPTNRFCLVDDVDAAFQLAQRFSNDEEKWESGPYVVVEVSTPDLARLESAARQP